MYVRTYLCLSVQKDPFLDSLNDLSYGLGITLVAIKVYCELCTSEEEQGNDVFSIHLTVKNRLTSCTLLTR